MGHRTGCLYIPFEEAQRIPGLYKKATGEDMKKLIEISPSYHRNIGDDITFMQIPGHACVYLIKDNNAYPVANPQTMKLLSSELGYDTWKHIKKVSTIPFPKKQTINQKNYKQLLYNGIPPEIHAYEACNRQLMKQPNWNGMLAGSVPHALAGSVPKNMSPNHYNLTKTRKNGENMSVFEAVGKALSKPAAKVGLAAAGIGAAAGSVLGASAASPTINNKTDSTTVGNGNEAVVGFAIILLVILGIIGYALYTKKNEG